MVNPRITLDSSAALSLIWRSIFIPQVLGSVASCLLVKPRFRWTCVKLRGFAFVHFRSAWGKSNPATEKFWDFSGRACLNYAYLQKIVKLLRIARYTLFLNTSGEIKADASLVLLKLGQVYPTELSESSSDTELTKNVFAKCCWEDGARALSRLHVTKMVLRRFNVLLTYGMILC